MVIAALELDRAQIGDNHRAVIRVSGDQVGGHPAVPVQEHQKPHDGFAHPTGHLVEHIHARGGGIHLLGAALLHLGADVPMHVLHGELILAVEEGQRLRTLVGELLFHHEGGGHLVALIEVAVDDEAVQLGPQGDGLEQGGHHQVEHGVGEVRLRLVLLGQVCVHGRQVHLDGDVCLVVAAVGIDDAGDEVERIQLPQQTAVPAVAPASLLCFHVCLLCI